MDDSIALQDIPYVWKSLGNSVGLHVGFKFLRAYWSEIFEKLGSMNSVIQTIVEDFLSNLSTKVDLEDVSNFTQHSNYPFVSKYLITNILFFS